MISGVRLGENEAFGGRFGEKYDLGASRASGKATLEKIMILRASRASGKANLEKMKILPGLRSQSAVFGASQQDF